MVLPRFREEESVRAPRARDRLRAAIEGDGDSRSMHDLYQSDLDRHFWAWGKSRGRRKRLKGKKRRGRRLAKLVASAAGALGAAGISYVLFKRLQRDERSDETLAEQGTDED